MCQDIDKENGMSNRPAFLIYYVIYDSPRDYPGKFVVRKWTQTADGKIIGDHECHVSNDIQGARKVVKEQYPLAYNIGRYVSDDPSIREVWI